MSSSNKISIFIFRRDFRLHDNTGLLLALSESDKVLPIFIFTPEQVTRNSYKSNNCIQFMIESLHILDSFLRKLGSRLFYFYGHFEQVLKSIISQDKIKAIYVNKDFTPYSKQRDDDIKILCDKHDITFKSCDDCTLYPIGSITTTQNHTYTKYTPFYNAAVNISVKKPIKNTYRNYVSRAYKLKNELHHTKIDNFYETNLNIAVRGGRIKALDILKNISNFKNYNTERNMLAIPTTKLSAYNKFGCVSIREVYHAIRKSLGMKNELIKQLYWREFYYNIMNSHPNVMFGNLKESFNSIKWITLDKASDNQKYMFNKWCKGETGFPIIDACMIELNTTGYMHNRGRLIVASFLIHNLYISWQEGEKYFATKLVDIDPSQNNGNWQWVSGAGVQTVPYMRLVFNPWSQSEKYDPDCIYIKHWIPELKDIPAGDLHHWDIHYEKYPNLYAKPIVDFNKTRQKSIEHYRNI